MIILPEEEEQLPKLASPLPIHPVNRRPTTPTPSLPDYETSQKQEQKQTQCQKTQTQWHMKQPQFLAMLSPRWRFAFWSLVLYFFVTAGVGIPIIVMKARSPAQYNKNPSMLYPSPAAYGSKNSSGVYGFNLGQFPVCVDDARACDTWDFKDREENGVLRARLMYTIPVDSTIWIQSNVSCLPIAQVSPVTGSLSVAVSQDPTDTDATLKISMTYTGKDVRERTSVCVMNLVGSDGVYIYVPSNLKAPDHLDFKITMTLPQPTSKKPRYIANFLTYLPYFAQYIGTVSPRLTFGSVALGGWKSNVTVDYMQAEAMLLKTPYANFNGMLNITSDNDEDDYS